MHITLEVTRDGGPYERGRDEPVYAAHDGPNCRGLPDPHVPAPEVPVADGYDHGGTRTRPSLPVGTPSGAAAPPPAPRWGGPAPARRAA